MLVKTDLMPLQPSDAVTGELETRAVFLEGTQNVWHT